MANNPIAGLSLPQDLPTNWSLGQTVGPNGTDVGLTQQHGYNYLGLQVNVAQQAAQLLGAAFTSTASIDSTGKLVPSEIPNIDCGVWDTDPVAEHNVTPLTHTVMKVDGNASTVLDTSSTLEEHISNPDAHQNLIVDGNLDQ